MAETNSTDVTEVIRTQHEQIKQLFSEVDAAGSDKTKAEQSFCELRRLIAVHETAEELIIYPALRLSGDEGRSVADARTAEEDEGTELLSKLESLEVGGGEFNGVFSQFRTAVTQHAESEESTVFPILRQTQSEDLLAAMAKSFEVAEKTAPTHAHPHVGTSAVTNLMAGPALAIMDRVRDALSKG